MSLKRVMLSSAAGLVVVWGAGAALANEPGTSAAPDVRTLQAEVEALKALVRTQADRDRHRIDDLSDQVRALKAQVQETPVATAAVQATPRAAQDTGVVVLGQAKPGEGVSATRTEPRVIQNSTHRLLLQSVDKEYSIGLSGIVQFDSGVYNLHADSTAVGPQAISNGVNARRARIGIVGTAPGGWSFGFVYDGGNSQDTTAKGIQTAQIVYGGIKGVAVEAGYSNTYFTLDQSTSSADLLFLERSSASNIATNFNAGDSRTNAGVRLFGDRYWAGAYVTGPASGDSHTLTAERVGAFERVAVQALKGKDYSLHLGVGLDQLIQASNAGNGTPKTLSLSDQPELRIDPTTLLNTGAIGAAGHQVTGGSVYNLETAASWKGLFWQGEYYWYQVERQGLAANHFTGWYGQAAWTLTGETHTYNPQSGSYFRIYPSHPFSLAKGDLGAWEVAVRADYVNLNSRYTPGVALSAQPNAVLGGTQRGLSVGLNWYPNDLVRFLLDYNHIDYDKASGTKVTGVNLGDPVGTRFDAISLRAQVVY